MAESECQGIQREHVVRFNSTDCSVSCECKLFESKGWLCRHALRVLNGNISVTGIPSSYILKRWTKGAKQGIANDESRQTSPGPSKFNRFSILMQESFEVMSLGAENENTMRIVKKHLGKAKAELLSYKSSMVVTDDMDDDDDDDDNDDDDDDDDDDDNDASLCEISVLDPIRRKGKGTSNGRLESSSEKKRKNSKRGTPSMPIENQELIARAVNHETHFPDYLRNSNQIRSGFYPSNNSGVAVNLNLHNQMQPPYIVSPGILNYPFPNQMQSPYIMSPGVINGFYPFTSQMSEYHSRSHGTILSQESSNSSAS